MSVRPSVCLSVHLFVCSSIRLSVYQSVCLSVCLSASKNFILWHLLDNTWHHDIVTWPIVTYPWSPYHVTYHMTHYPWCFATLHWVYKTCYSFITSHHFLFFSSDSPSNTNVSLCIFVPFSDMEIMCHRCRGRLPHLVDHDHFFWSCRFCRCLLAKKGPGEFTKPTMHKRKCQKIPDIPECVCHLRVTLPVEKEMHISSDLCWGECCLTEPDFKGSWFPKHLLTTDDLCWQECCLTEPPFKGEWFYQ